MVKRLEEDLDWVSMQTLPLFSEYHGCLCFSLSFPSSVAFQLPVGQDVPLHPGEVRPRVHGQLRWGLLQKPPGREHPSPKNSIVSGRESMTLVIECRYSAIVCLWTYHSSNTLYLNLSSSDDLVQLCVDYLREYPLLVGSGLACPVLLLHFSNVVLTIFS